MLGVECDCWSSFEFFCGFCSEEAALVVSEAVRSASFCAWLSRMRLSSLLTRVWILSSTSWAREESVYGRLGYWTFGDGC